MTDIRVKAYNAFVKMNNPYEKEDLMTREFTCIMCPNGCLIETEYDPAPASEGAPVIRSVSGNLCPRGAEYVLQELTDPRRTIATSIPVIVPSVS